MTKNMNIINEFHYFLAKEFAKNENEWNKYVNYLALDFLEYFYKNLEFMHRQLKNNKQKNTELSFREKQKRKSILRIFKLFNLFDLDFENKKLTVNINKIKEAFVSVEDQKEEEILKTAINELDEEKELEEKIENKKSNYLFSDLTFKFNLVIGYINLEKIREHFFNQYLLKKTNTNINKAGHNFYIEVTNNL